MRTINVSDATFCYSCAFNPSRAISCPTIAAHVAIQNLVWMHLKVTLEWFSNWAVLTVAWLRISPNNIVQNYRDTLALKSHIRHFFFNLYLKRGFAGSNALFLRNALLKLTQWHSWKLPSRTTLWSTGYWAAPLEQQGIKGFAEGMTCFFIYSDQIYTDKMWPRNLYLQHSSHKIDPFNPWLCRLRHVNIIPGESCPVSLSFCVCFPLCQTKTERKKNNTWPVRSTGHEVTGKEEVPQG